MMFMIAYYFILTNQHFVYSAYSVYSVITLVREILARTEICCLFMHEVIIQ